MRFIWILIFWSFIQPAQQQPLPEMNARVVEYVKSVLGEKVDRGECWDLANQALTYAGASWKKPLLFGRIIFPDKENILPGDIVQFTNVTMEHKEGTTTTRWKMIKHTAVVYQVISKSTFVLAEQNINQIKRVMLNEYSLDDIKTGKVEFYRPLK